MIGGVGRSRREFGRLGQTAVDLAGSYDEFHRRRSIAGVTALLSVGVPFAG